jgi:hypothetical protein
LAFFVPNKSENHACISGGSLLYRVGQIRILRRSILRGAVQANRFIGLISLLPKRLALLVLSQRHNKSLNTGLAIRSRSLFNTGCSQPVKQTLCGIQAIMVVMARAVVESGNIES